jgi:hypothetical protein
MKKALLLFCLISSSLVAQTEKQAFGILFSGFVKTDLFYDSRQSVTIREGHFLLYPQNEHLDINLNDINDKSSFNILSIQSRVNAKITSPEVMGAKPSAVLEGEFFGTSDADINGFRLRHAFVKLDWEKTSLLVGQTWHPMFIVEMFPGVVSFNTGAPFQPFSRNPQIRFTHSMDKIKFIAAVASQRDFASNGPEGFSSVYLRNSVVPNLNAQLQYIGENIFSGVGIDYKTITPRISTAKKVKTNESLSSLSFTGFAKLSLNPVTFKLQGVYGSNLADHLMLGGYAISVTDTISGIEKYTGIKCFSVWGEISVGKDIEYAIFAGYTKNLGAEDNIAGSYYGRGTNIGNVFRVSPRVQFTFDKLRISTEFEYTSSAYGTPNNLNKGKVENVKDFSNLRIIGAVYYFF